MGIGIWELVLLLAIAIVVFGTKRLRNIGTDLGGAIKGFRGAMAEPDGDKGGKDDKARTIDGEAVNDKKDNA